MIQIHRFLLSCGLSCLLSFSAFAEAPVVEEGDSFALMDDQGAANEQPLAHESITRDTSELNSSSDNAALVNKLQGLQQDMQELRGQLDVQTHELKRLQEQQLSFYKDLDARIAHEPQVASNPPSTITTPMPPTEQQSPQPLAAKTNAHGNPADEQISYLAAYELIQKKDFNNAISAMQTFVTQYPQGGYTANAHYWLGELYLVKKDYPQAVEQFDTVLKQFPSSSKTAASQLKMGYALAADGKVDEAKHHLKTVIKSYPDTPTARLASTKLAALD